MTEGGLPRPIDVLPHRPPFLLVDELTSLDPGRAATGRWTLTGEEYFFAGHFPDYPVLPGVLLVESLAQLGAAAGLATESGSDDDLPLLAGVDKARFKRQVVPGDVIDLSIELTHRSARAGKMAGRATVDGQLACRVEFMFVVVRWSEVPGPTS